jgi:DNA repair protein RadD
MIPYQIELVDELERKIAQGIKRILIAAPTGSGKTVIISEIIRRAKAKLNTSVFIAHRDELLTQAHGKLKIFGVDAGIIKSGRDKDLRPQALVQICGIQTLHARAVRAKTIELPPAHLVIVDECHHARAMTYQTILASYPDAIVIGLTATPCRGDGRGLGNIFEAMIEAPQIGELIKLKHLVPLRIFAPAPPDLRGVEVASTGD